MRKITEYFVAQSARPHGTVGRLMLRLMNRAYLPMATWALELPPMAGGGPGDILDVGMGNGATSALLRRRFTQSAVVGVDVSPDAVAEARKKHPEIEFAVADACGALPFAEGRFGLVCAFQTHFHWGDMAAGFAALRRVLKAEGTLLVAFESVKLEYHAPTLREEKAVQALLRGAGFAAVRVVRHGGWTAWVATC